MKIINLSTELEIVQDYLNNMSLNEVAQKYGTSISYVSNAVNRNGHETRSISEGMKQYKIDDTFFEKIDTSAKATILGFIYADGCLSNPSKYSDMISITLNNKDKDYLEWIKLEMKSESPLKQIITQNAISLRICNQKLCADIRKLGIHERKSLDLSFPNLNQVSYQFIPAFTLGYFEGDGCICWGRTRKTGKIFVQVGICCTLEFYNSLSKILSEQGIETSLYRKKDIADRNVNSYSLIINTGPRACKFFDWLYKNHTGFKMQRKYDKFKQFRDLYDENYNFIETPEWLAQKSERLAKAGTGRVYSEETLEKMRKSAQAREDKKKLENPREPKIIKHHMSDDTKSEMVQYYLNNQVSLAETGLKYGVSNKCVERSVKKLGFQTRPTGKHSK